MARASPLLNEPAPGWKRDLPSPNQPVLVLPNVNKLNNSPNYVSGIYLELPRATVRTRGLGLWLGSLFVVLSAVLNGFLMYAVSLSSTKLPLGLLLIGLAITGFLIWWGIVMIRTDLAPPRDEPIRFNRLRRKVYVYRFHHNGLRPFSRSAWGVRPEVYNWDDLHAEACSAYGPLGTGGLIENITLTVLKPGTREVLDRFIFAHDIDHGEEYWAMAQLFMQQGPQALPTFSHSPRDWNNEDARFNLARRFAPKVQWPADMDLESRTAP